MYNKALYVCAESPNIIYKHTATPKLNEAKFVAIHAVLVPEQNSNSTLSFLRRVVRRDALVTIKPFSKLQKPISKLQNRHHHLCFHIYSTSPPFDYITSLCIQQ